MRSTESKSKSFQIFGSSYRIEERQDRRTLSMSKTGLAVRAIESYLNSLGPFDQASNQEISIQTSEMRPPGYTTC